MAEEYDVAVEGKAFLLRPDIPKEGRQRSLTPDERGGALNEPLRSYAENAGLVMRRFPLTPYTQYALETTEYAKEYGLFDPVHRALYRAYWEDGKDLGDFGVLERVAGDCGLDWPELRDRLESRHYEREIATQFQEGLNLGINGIPGFLIGNILFTGARPYSVFRAVMGKLAESGQYGPAGEGSSQP